jgi:hypothetical protein
MFHLLSPFIYASCVKALDFVPRCPDSSLMKSIRRFHNIILSVLSGLMFLGITVGTYQSGKFNSWDAFLCQAYPANAFVELSFTAFLYSKYLEWGDTLFLHLSGKAISQLQYTHHMSTAILVQLNRSPNISPFIYTFMASNCLVHLPMYWYFAYPKGFLYPYRKMITQSQIVQHIACVTTVVYTYFKEDCAQNGYGLYATGALYCMYLFYFSVFYLNTYYSRKDK